ncbi:hypothetical protein [Bacillus sp. FSL K6-3431]|uniref:hypothetical protein n=1 Tax=Bacillus sp. FSL K6-3431 TaxID=2921500 RepID=UPI0030FB1C9B
MKVCKECGNEKEVSEFYKAGSYKGSVYYGSKCKDCTRSQAKDYRTKNPVKVAASKRASEAKKPEYYKNIGKTYYRNNRDKILKQMQENYFNNREKKKLYGRKYHHNNAEKISIKSREYYLANKDIFKFHRFQRKSRERGSIIELTNEQRAQILERFKYRCPITDSLNIHMDHFIPVKTGYGDTIVSNLIPLDKTLNLSKGAKNPFEWVKERGDIDLKRFESVVFYLAELNGLSPEEYEAHVYNCFD